MNQFSMVGRIQSGAKPLKTLKGGIYHGFELGVLKNFREQDLSYKVESYNIVSIPGVAYEGPLTERQGELVSVYGRIEAIDNEILLIAERVELLK